MQAIAEESLPRYAVNLLGTWQVLARGGALISRFRGDKVRALLAYLAVEAERPHARAELVGLLWPEVPGELAGRNLSQSLVRLRQALGVRSGAEDDPLSVTRQSVQWRAEVAQVDVTMFTRTAVSSDLADLERAAALYRGEFMAGFGLPDCEAFEEWLLVNRERLKDVALGVLHAVAERKLAGGRTVDAVAAARRQLTLEPWRESAHRQLMQALAAGGDRPAALGAFARCCEILRAELDTPPEEETRRLAERIQSGDVTLRPSMPDHAHNLPAPLTHFVGREPELARVAELLDGGTRLLTVIGTGGTGKTRLALAAAWALRSRFADGVWWVPLAGLQAGQDPALTRDTLADAIGSALSLTYTGRGTPLEELAAALRGRNSLLLLDNCEHLPDVGPVARTLLEAAPDVRLLATSRAPLGVEGETLLSLRGLPVPGSDVPDAAHYAGVQLLLERASRLTPVWAKGPSELAGAVRLCRLLEGLPLGIELAAQWLGHFSPDEIARELQADLDFLASRRRDVPDRQRSLRAAFSYSWGLLRAEEQQALAGLSVFRGSFDRAAAQAVAGVRATILVSLAGKSLVEHAGLGRYRLHDLLRQFATERLAGRGETVALGERHAAHYLALAERAAPQLVGPDQAAGTARLEGDRDNLLAALSWAREHERPEMELRLAGGLAHFWVNRGYAREGREWLGDALTRADKSALPVMVRARACHGAGLLANIQGAQDEAVRWLEEGIALYGQGGDPVSAVRALNTLGGVAYDRGNLSRAGEVWGECLRLARAAGDTGGAAWALGNVGEVLYHQGDTTAAAAHHEEALTLAGQAGRNDIEALALSDLGNDRCRQGDLAGAAELFRQALVIMRRLGDRRRIAVTLENFAGLAVAAGQGEHAARWLGAADAVRLEIGTPRPEPERRAADQARAVATVRMGAATFAAAFAAGRTLSLDEVLAEVCDTQRAGEPDASSAGT